MTALPTLPTIGTGVMPTSQVNQLRDAVAFLYAKPILRVRQTVTQNITTGGAFQPITFTTEDIDSANGHDNAVNTSRYTAVYPGWYHLDGAVCWPANATGQRAVGWAKNGTNVTGSETSIQGFATLTNRQVARSISLYLDVGDYAELMAFQNSGGTLATDITANSSCSMDITWERGG